MKHRYGYCSIEDMSIPRTILPHIAKRLRARVDDNSVAMVAEAARALEPVLTRAAEARPSRLTALTRRGAVALGGLTPAERAGRLARFKNEPSIAIMFADIADFTGYTAENGDEAAIALLGRVAAVVARAAGLGKGEVIKHMGDGYLLVFPSSSQAIRAGLYLNEGITRLGEDGDHVAMRIVVHDGSPTIEDDDIFGHDVNLAAHLMDHCKPGSVMVSQAAKERSERRLRKASFDRRKRVRVQGLRDRIEVWRVVATQVDEPTSTF